MKYLQLHVKVRKNNFKTESQEWIKIEISVNISQYLFYYESMVSDQIVFISVLQYVIARKIAGSPENPKHIKNRNVKPYPSHTLLQHRKTSLANKETTHHDPSPPVIKITFPRPLTSKRRTVFPHTYKAHGHKHTHKLSGTYPVPC